MSGPRSNPISSDQQIPKVQLSPITIPMRSVIPKTTIDIERIKNCWIFTIINITIITIKGSHLYINPLEWIVYILSTSWIFTIINIIIIIIISITITIKGKHLYINPLEWIVSILSTSWIFTIINIIVIIIITIAITCISTRWSGSSPS